MAVLLVFTTAVSFYAQDVSVGSTAAVTSEVGSGDAPTDITLQTPLDQITFSSPSTPSGTTALEAPSSTKFSTFWLFLRMIFVLAVIIAIVYLVIRFLKKTNKIPSDDEMFLRKVSQVTLAPGKTAQVITLLDHAYIVGVSDDSVNLIAEVTDTELIQSMNTYADKKQGRSKPKSFQEILDIFLNGKKGAAFEEGMEKLRGGEQ